MNTLPRSGVSVLERAVPSSPIKGGSLSTKPRVLHIVDSLEVGGMERLVHDLVIDRGGDTTSVACLESLGSFGVALRRQGIRVELIGTKGGTIPTVYRLWRHLRRAQPDVLHCHSFFAFLNASLAARLSGQVPLVFTKHGASIPGTGLGSRTNRLLLRKAEVVAVSRQAKEVMQAWMRNGRRVHYIPNGISFRAYENLPGREEARARLGLPSDAFVVGIVARIASYKGHHVLIDAFSVLRKTVPGSLLLIAGDGPGLSSVREHVRNIEIDKSVWLMGERNDVPEILAALDVFCLPSETEGMPMTILEAMAAGVPVIASNVGGIPDLVEDCRSGLLISPGAPDKLNRALLAIARDQRRREMGRAARERFLRGFTLDRAVRAYEELYCDAIARARII